ncbi:MAG: 2-hydroxyglutaryl-CoA dehydratase, partial [Clostridia bacterium]|nr:2-hydroxyglutaryl-CoA dehydratase [Clostridia bacterium]
MTEKNINYKVGIDCGSKTVKAICLNSQGNILYKSYLRHRTDIQSTILRTFREMREKIGDVDAQITFTGSAGMQVAQDLDLPFIQEVVASKTAISRYNPGTDVVIELGGEDSKILFLTGGEELRMNSTCAGGTGGFIDTIAAMVGTNAAGLSRQYATRTVKRPIASRCAVFARNDVRAILNEGVSKGDIAASTFMAVVNQCVSGLACGRKIKGNVVFLG